MGKSTCELDVASIIVTDMATMERVTPPTIAAAPTARART
jgi:hypothetical protein